MSASNANVTAESAAPPESLEKGVPEGRDSYSRIDENPFVYKNIHDVMAAQSDLVDVVARFDPKIVKMADAGEKPED